MRTGLSQVTPGRRNRALTRNPAQVSHARGPPHIAGTAVAFTPHRYNQDEVARELTEFAEPGIRAENAALGYA
jgi:hypothetical protein